MSKKGLTRRKFISGLALSVAGASTLLTSCSGFGKLQRTQKGIPAQLRDQAPDGKVLKAGLVGCGGRGGGAALNFVDAGPNLEVVALGDLFQDQLDKCRANLKAARNIDIPDGNCFVGFDSYKKIMDTEIDVVILASPPHFRPAHVKAAVDAGKHIFQEKPVAVDPVGSRLMMESTQKAKQKNLCMVSGTVRRYQKDYMETQRRVADGQIGEVVGASIVRNGGAYWWVERKPEWTDMEYMLRNWGNFSWLSGDFIVEILLHEIDVMNWHVGKTPVKAIAYGGRQQNVAGNQYDHFSVVYEYENGMQTHCMNRHINGCANGKTEHITGTQGYADASGFLYSHDGELIWEYPYPEENGDDQTWNVNNPYVQQHVELVTGIRTGRYINDSEEQIHSTRMAVMGRMAAYTGQEVTWNEILTSDLRLGPETYEWGPVTGIPNKPPVVGISRSPSDKYS